MEKVKPIVILLILSSFFCSQAMAKTQETTVLETVIVTESGQKTKLLDTNAAIHVITAKDIMNSGQSNTAELISSIPGVINEKSSSQTYFSIRGTRTTMSGGPKIYVDGRPINVGVYGYSKIDSIPLDNIEKIEVIKSPPTSKYGESAGRGVILITTKKGRDAEDVFNGVVSGEYGSWDSRKLNAGFSGKSNRLDYSLSAYASEAEGFRHDDSEIKSAEGQIGWQFEGAHIDWITGVNQTFNKNPAALPEWQLARDRRVAAVNSKADGSGYLILPNESDEDFFNTLVKFEYDKNDWLLNSSAGFTRDHQDFKYLKKVNDSVSSYYRDDRTDNIYDFMASVGRQFNTQSTSNTLSFGVDYQYSDFEQDRSYPLDPSKDEGTTCKKADINAEKKIFGANLNHDFSWDIFRLQTGLRYNNVSYDLSSRLPDSIKVEFEHDIDWSISPSVNILDNANLFITWNHSNFYLPLAYYKSNMEKDFLQTLEPEKYDTIEAGWKHQVHKAFNYSLILYWTRVEDKVMSYYSGATLLGRRNAGTSIHQGVEAEADGRPFDWLGYRISLATIDAEWDEGEYRGYASPSAGSKTLLNLAGKKVNYVPEYEYALGLDFFPIRNTSYGSLTVALDLHGFGERYEDANNSMKMPDAHYLDAKITWALKGFECYLACTNVFDREWDKISNTAGESHATLFGFYPQDGRYIGVGMTYRF